MFKPSLKRSKLEEIQLYTKTYEPPHSQHTIIKSGKKQVTENQSFDIEQNITFPTSFYSEESKSKLDSSLLFNPLNFEWSDYPLEIRKKINGEEEQNDWNRSIGCYKNLIWYYHGNFLHIWSKKQRQVFKYQMHKDTNCIEIGQIESSSLHFKTRNLYIVAAGVTNRLFLFGIDKETFSMSDLKFNYEVLNSRYIQKIKFINENEIIFGSDTSYFCHLDFASETKIAFNHIPIIQKAFPFLPLIYPTSHSFIEEILMSENTIYVLVREQKPVNWLSLKAKETLNFLMMKNQQIHHHIIERKRVEVYDLDRKTNKITFLHQINEQHFIKKLKSKHPQVTEIKDPQGLKIVSIYLNKNDLPNGLLSIVTKCGYFITINQTQNIIIGSHLLKAPKENNIGVVGLFLEKKDIEDENLSKDNHVKLSFGMNNLTLMNNSLWYFSQHALEPIKCDKIEGGDILEMRSEGFDQQKWLVFTKIGFYKISRLVTSQVFLSYLVVRNHLALKSPQKWTDEANFELFIENLSKMIGYEKICESLIDFLLLQKLEFKVAQPLLHMIEDELRGYSNKNYRDWTYTLSKSSPVVPIRIDENVIDQVWKYLIELQSKHPKQENPQMTSQNIICNSYWYALRSLFVKYSLPLLKVQAKSIKSKIAKIEESIRFLQTLTKFFFLKKEKQLKYLSQSILNRTSNPKEKSLPKASVTKLKPFSLSSPKKQDEKTEASLDQSTLIIQQQTKFINESSTKLENIITLSIKKLKTMVTIFLYLADLPEHENIGNIEEIFKSREKRMIVRKHLIARVEDVEKLQEFSKILPQLQLNQTLQFNKWLLYQQKYKKPEMANLAQIATFISSEEFEKLKIIFEDRYDSQADLLLLYWDHLFGSMSAINMKQYLQSKHNELFSAERAYLENERKEYISSEMKAIEAEVQTIITNAIKAYISSNQENYPKSEKMINSIIKIITSHDDNNLISYAEEEMGKFGLAQKLILLRKLKKKIQVPLTANEILTKRKYVETKPKAQREFLSNYELYLLQSDK